MKNEMDFLWQDRKRILGMPITFTKYSISEDRLFLEKGFLTISIDEILLYRIRDISLKMTLGQRIFGVGSIIVNSTDKTMPNLEIKNVKNPIMVKELIHKKVEEMKLARKMRIGEVLESSDCDCDNDDEIDD